MPTANRAQMFSFALRTASGAQKPRSTLLIRTAWCRPWRPVQACLAARLEGLLANHAPTIHFRGDRLETPLFVCRRWIEDHRTTDRLRRVWRGGNLRRLRNVNRC